MNVKDITYEIREKITFSTAKTPTTNITTVNQMLENPRLYFSGRGGNSSNYATPKSTNINFRPSSKGKKHHNPGSFLNNQQYSKKDTNSILNDSIMRNSRYYTAKNYKKSTGGYKKGDNNQSTSQQKYYSVDHKRGVKKRDSFTHPKNYSMERERSKYVSNRGRSESREYSKYSVRNYKKKTPGELDDNSGTGGTKKMLDKMIKKMMHKHNRKGKSVPRKFPEGHVDSSSVRRTIPNTTKHAD